MNLEVTCSYILTRIIRSLYIYQVTTCADSRHFDSSTGRCWRCNDCGRFFQDPDISKNILPFPALPAIDDTLRTHHPMSGMGSLNLLPVQYSVMEISHTSGDGFEAGSIGWKSRRCGRRRQLNFQHLWIRHARAKFGGDWTRRLGDPD